LGFESSVKLKRSKTKRIRTICG